MGIYDRDYYQNEDDRGSFGSSFGGGMRMGGPMRMWSITTWLILINAVIFLLDMILTGSTRAATFSPHELGRMSIRQITEQFQLWRVVTYQFLHGGLFHIFFNMLALYFFGPMVERYLGSRRFLAFYLLSGIGGAALFMALGLLVPGLIFNMTALQQIGLNPNDVGLVGASACVFGVLMAGARIAPDTRVMLLIPPIPMKLKTLAYVFLGIAVFTVVVGGSNAGGEAGHLGGALVGAILIRKVHWLNWAASWRGFRGRSSPFGSKNNGEGFFDKRRSKRAADMDEEVNRILAKVGTQGIHSLTDKEKKTLARATEEQRKRNAE